MNRQRGSVVRVSVLTVVLLLGSAGALAGPVLPILDAPYAYFRGDQHLGIKSGVDFTCPPYYRVQVANLLGEIRPATLSGIDMQRVCGDGAHGSGCDVWLIHGNPGDPGGSDANTVSVEFMADNQITTSGDSAYGIISRSQGGNGGGGADMPGAFYVVGGAGGRGGNGGPVLASNDGSILTRGVNAFGILAESRGGVGGHGGWAGAAADGVGGNGGVGGTGGQVSVFGWANGSITTSGTNADGIVAQSLGGAGGNGGTGGGIVGEGGNALGSGPGGPVDVVNYGSVHTAGKEAYGIFAQSVGGQNGGAAGGGGIWAWGGSGTSAGDGGQITVRNSSTITTLGNDSDGITALSIGGGGGRAGETSGVVSWGGDGSAAGDGRTVHLVNRGQVQTGGPNAAAIYAQSTGGGGGSGAISGGLIAFGGKGGAAGNGGPVRLENYGNLATGGVDATALFAQSIGGGGGNAGGAVSVSAFGGFALGGKGNSGGRSAPVDVESGALTISTQGDRSHGIFAQSVGGGGGNGGGAVTLTGGLGGSVSVAAGGEGALGGDGNLVHVLSLSSISTSGQDAHAVFAQSIGGGGGTGGFSIAGAGSDGVGVSLAFGGKGGAGGHGKAVDLASAGALSTSGDRSYGLFAQSVGGGGGTGGFSIAGAGGGLGGGAFSLGGSGGGGGNGDTVVVDSSSPIITHGNQAFGLFAQSLGGGGGNGGFSMAAAGGGVGAGAISVGGTGDAGGISKSVTVNSSGDIDTFGYKAYGLFAQSIGGGGGNGGFSISGAGAGTGSGSVSVGGMGNGGGSSDTVWVYSQSSITTGGEKAHALFAQSAGGGGGDGGFSLAFSGAGTGSGSISVGGFAAEGGDGKSVTVDSSGMLETLGKGAIGLFAQSVGGGGGQGGFSISGSAAGTGSGAFSLGGFGGKGGKGGAIVVDSTSTIKTANVDAYGIFAQSIGGGGGNGGFSIAGSGAGTGSGTISIGGFGGDGGDSEHVTVHHSGVIETNGEKATGLFAQSVGGGGGNGSFSISASGAGTGSGAFSLGGFGATGGQGNNVLVDNTMGSRITTLGAEAHGVFAQSVGGGGGNGGFSIVGSGAGTGSGTIGIGGFGAKGGNGMNVTVNSTGVIETTGDKAIGLFAQSVGGGGGNGSFSISGSGAGTGSGAFSLGGGGGKGGNGSTVLVDTKLSTASSIKTLGDEAYGILAQSVGGGGGNGGFSIVGSGAGTGSGAIGIGGFGASGGSSSGVTVRISGTVDTSGRDAIGLVAQSIGGGGGNGSFSISGSGAGTGSGSFSLGGAGAAGSDAGAVLVQAANTSIVTRGDNAHGMLVQSAGGGGGNGGFSVTGSGAMSGSGSIGIGGFGGGGGDGQSVTVTGSGTIDTYGNHSTGLLAQSVGGGGGTGNFSIAGSGAQTGAGTFSLGGRGGAGGKGQSVAVDSSSQIATRGIVAYGILAQSVGGGGGAGGFSFTGGVIASGYGGLNASVGGFGGAGGNASTVDLTNRGPVSTANSGAHAVFAQSVGGGGGTGGFSGSVSAGGGKANVALSVGGWGGVAGDGQAASLLNQAYVHTQGTAAYGLFAQSVGGGGGDGGGSFSAALGTGQGGWNGSLSIGGFGRAAGSGGTVKINDNTGNILTEGTKSHGLVAQSVGGGGGSGGFSATGLLATGPLSKGTKAKNIGISVGGFGGAGGDGGIVEVLRNKGNITTQTTFSGDIPDEPPAAADPLDVFGIGAAGILAQSIGGGGGNGGFSFSGSFGGLETKNFGVSVGGFGGAGGKGMRVTVDNEGLIGTKGANSQAILAQSIGGGGGNGGASVAIDFGASNKDGTSSNYSLSVGGFGGSGNTAGAVDVTNRRGLTTNGTFSDGILAQSIGGGGGNGGIALTATLSSDAEWKQTNGGDMTFGGKGGNGNHGGPVTVKNYATVDTLDDNSSGIFAQSVGGGGGKGGAARAFVVKYDPSKPIKKNPLTEWIPSSLAAGGCGGGASDGSTVSVTNTAAITTEGAESYGILAQSVGGGGGLVSDGTAGIPKVPAWLKPVLKPTPIKIGSSVVLGGSDGSSGNGDVVTVNNQGSITTHGPLASAIFAQSTGAGGGIVNSSAGGHVRIGGEAGVIGDGRDVTVTHAGQIETFGPAANGIDAQSVGGGGGKAGSIEGVPDRLTFLSETLRWLGGGQGNGGAVTIESGGNIIAHGSGAHGIFAQSVGGGGGVAGDTTLGSRFAGSVGGDGSGGTVKVTHAGNVTTLGDGSYGILAQSPGGKGSGGSVEVTLGAIDLPSAIDAQGVNSSGIVAQSTGQAGAGSVFVSILAGSSVLGGSWDGLDVEKRGVGVKILDGANNTLTNSGSIAARSGLAIIGGAGNDTILNSGTITGTVDLGGGANALENQSTHIFNSGATVYLGAGNTLTNAGTLSPGGSGAVLETTLIGRLAQSDTGVLRIELGGTAAGLADRLNVSGQAQLDGTLGVALADGFRPAHNDQFTVLTFDSRAGDFAAKQGLDLSDRLTLVPAYGEHSLLLTAIQGGSGTWRSDQDGAASIAGNWQGGLPNGIGDTATFGRAISGPRTVTTATGTILGGMQFDSAQRYTIAGSLDLQTAAGEAVINTVDGAHQISASLNLASDAVVQGAGDLEISGSMSGSHGLRKSGTGNLSLSGVNTYQGGTSVDGGVLRFDSADAIPASGAIDVKSGGTATVSPALLSTLFPTLLGRAASTSAGTVALSADSFGVVDMSRFSSLSLGAVGSVAFSASHSLTPNGSTYRLGGGGGTLTFSPAITGVSSLVVCGGGSGGTVVLTGANDYTGGTTVSAGVLRFDSAIPASGDIDVRFGGTAATSPLQFPTLLARTNTASTGTLALTADSTATVSMSGWPGLSLGAVGAVAFTHGFTPDATTYRLGGGGGKLTFSRAITGGNSLVVCGSGSGGTVVLASANTYTGDTTINGGTLEYGINNALPASGSVNVAGGTLEIGTFNGVVGAITLSSGSITGSTGILTGASYNLQKGSISAILSGPDVNLTKTTADTVTLSGANTYTGATLVDAGMLEIGLSGSLTSAGNIRVAGTGGAVLSVSGTVTMADGKAFGVGSGLTDGIGTVIVNSGGSLFIGAGSGYTAIGGDYLNAAGTGRNSQFGTGTLTINGGIVHVAAPGSASNGPGGTDATRLWLNPYGGTESTLNLNGGTLSTARPIANGSPDPAVATINFNGGTLQADADMDVFRNSGPLTLNVRNNGAIVDTSGFDVTITRALLHSTIAGDATMDGGLTKAGTGILRLTGDNTYTGGTIIEGGELHVGNGGATGRLGTGPITNHGSLVFNRTDDIAVRSAISGTGSLTKQGPNTLLLTGSNDYSGGTTLADGTLSFLSGSLGPSGSIVFSGDATLQWNGSNTQDLSNRLSVHSGVAATVDTMANSVTFASPLAQAAGALHKAGPGTLTFAGAAGLAQDVTVSQGTIVANISSGVGAVDGNYGQKRVTSGKFVLGDAGTGSSEARLGLEGAYAPSALYALNNDIDVAAGPSGRLVIYGSAGSVAAGVRGTVTLNNNVIFRNELMEPGRLALEGKITGTGNATIESAAPSGVISLHNTTNNWTGDLAVASGQLQLGANGVIPSTANVTINSGAQMSYGPGVTAQSIGGLSGEGNISGGSSLGTLTVGNQNRDGSFGGAITGNLRVIKTGTGTQALSGANTYTGGTTVEGGMLLLPAGGFAGNVDVTTADAKVAFLQAADASYGGIISGSGGPTKTGGHCLSLYGNNTYTGTTTISEGTLKLGYTPSGAELWLDAANADSLAVNADGTGGTPVPGGTVGRWTSLVGSKYANISLGGPTYETNVQHGQPVVRFSGTNPLTFDAPLTADGTTMFIVFLQRTSAGWVQPVDSASSWLHLTNGTTRRATISGGAFNIDGGVSPATWAVQEVQVQSGNYQLWIDNVLKGTSSNTSTIGPFINVGGNLQGDIGELLIYDGQLSPEVRTNIYNYLAAKWIGSPPSNSIPDTSPVAVGTGATLDLASYSETVGPLSGSGRVLLGSGTLTVNSASDSEFSGMISGAGGLTKTAGKKLTLTGPSNYTGATLVKAGTLEIAPSGGLDNTGNIHAAAVGGAALSISGTVTMASGRAFGVGSGLTGATGTVTVNSGGVLTIGGGNGYTAIGGDYLNAAGTGLVGQIGTGTLTITSGGMVNVAKGGTASNGPGGTNTTHLWLNPYGGSGSTINLNGVALSTGTLSTARPIANGNASGSATINFNGGALRAALGGINILDAQGPLTVNVRNNGAILDTNGSDTTIAVPLLHSTISGDNAIDGGLTKIGAGKLTLSAASTYNGGTTIGAGTLETSGAGTLGAADESNNIVVANGATLRFSRHDTFGNAFVATPPCTITINGGTMTSNNTFTTLGPVVLSGGAIVDAGGAYPGYRAFTLRSTVTVLANADSSTICTAGGANNGIHLRAPTRFDVADGDAADDLVISAALLDQDAASPGAASLVKTGEGTMLLTGANSYTGGTTVSAGTLKGPALGIQGNVNLAAASAKLIFDQAAADGSYAGSVSGSGRLEKTGAAVLTLTGTNTYTGTTTLSAGTLQATKTAALAGYATPGKITVAEGATLAVSAGGPGEWNATATDDIGNLLTANGGGFATGSLLGIDTSNAPGSKFTYAPAMSGPQGLKKVGSGTLTLTGANTYSGATEIQQGTLQLDALMNLLPTTTAVNITAAGAALDLNNVHQTIGSLSGVPGSSVKLGTATLTVDGSTSTTIAGNISGVGGLVKAGPGTLTLTGDNTYTGGTTVSAGTLQGPSPSIQGNVYLAAPNARLAFDQTVLNVYAGIVSGSGSVTKTGPGILTLTGANTYTGGTTVSAGTLLAATTATLPGYATPGKITVAQGATLAVSAGGPGEWNATATDDIATLLTADGSRFATGSLLGIDTTNAPGSKFAYAPAISGPQGLNKLGFGTLTLTGANTYSGPTEIRQGTLQLDALTVLTGLQARFDASPLTGTDGSVVDTWPDTSGAGNDATRHAWYPRLKLAAQNGNNVVHFEPGGNSCFLFPHMADIRSVFWVVKEDTVGQHFLLGDDNTYHFHRAADGSIWDSGYASAFIRNGTTRLMHDGVIEPVNGTTTQLGTGFKLLDVVTTGNVEASRISYDRNIGGRSWDGDIGEILIYNRALTPDEVSAVEGYLNRKWFGTSSVAGNLLPTTTAVNITGAGAALDLNNVRQTIGSLSGVPGSLVKLGTATLTVGDSTSTTFAGNISGVGGVVKVGTGTLTLMGINTYSGDTLVNGGTLEIGTGGSVANTSRVVAVKGANLAISGSLTVAPNGVFAVGSGNGTPGTVVVKDGAVVNLGAGSGGTVGATYIGGKLDNTGDAGTGTLTIDGGTVNVAAGGSRPGGDGRCLWLNPWGGSGSTIQLNGGTLSTARPIANGGEPDSVATVNFNGGTLQAADATGLFDLQDPPTVNVQAGGATIDTNGLNSTIAPPLLHDAPGLDGGLRELGAGTLTLTGDSTYTGGTTIEGGTLQVGNGGATGTLGAGPITNQGSLVFNRTGDMVVSSVITGAGSLTKQGPNTLHLTGLNTYCGATLVKAGTLEIAPSGGLDNTGNIHAAAVGGAALSISGTVTMASGKAFGVGSGLTGATGTVTVNSGGVLTIGGGNGYTAIGGDYLNAAGTGRIGQIGTGTLTITSGGIVHVGAPGTDTNGPGGTDARCLWLNPYGGTGSKIELNGGTLSTARPIANGSGGAAQVNFDGGTLRATAGISIFENPGTLTLNVRDGGAIIDTNGFNTTISGALVHGAGEPDGGLTKIGAGKLTLSAANTFTGLTTISAGTLETSGAGTLGAAVESNNIVVANGVTLRFSRHDTFGNAFVATPPCTITINGGTMTSNNTFTTLGPVVLSGGAIVDAGGAYPGYRAFTLRSTVTVLANADSSTICTAGGANNGIHLRAPTTFDVADGDAADDLVISAALLDQDAASPGAASLVKTGEGTMLLTGANTYTGGTTVSDGTLKGPAGSIQGNVNLAAASAKLTFDQAAGTLQAARRAALADNSYAGTISGEGAVTKTGKAVLKLTGTNTYTGTTTVSAGTLQATKTAALAGYATSGKITVAEGATLAVSAGGPGEWNATATDDIAKVLTADANRFATGSLLGIDTTNAPGGKFTYSPAMSGPQGIKKMGSGTLTLTGANTYNGPTEIEQGTLQLDALTVLTGLTARFDASPLTGTDDSVISTWPDTSGAGNNATRGSSPAGYPQLKLGVQNGNSVVRFEENGNSWFSFPTMTDIRSVFWVVKESTAGGTDRHFLLGDDNTYHFHRGEGGNLWNGTVTSANIRNGTTRLGGEVKDGATTPLGTGFKLLDVVTTGNVEASRISRDRDIANRSWDGDIGEILIYNRALTSEEVLAVEDYLNRKWFGTGGVASNLLPTTTAVNITAAGAALDLNNVHQTIGSLAGVPGSLVKLGTATLTVGDWTSTTFAGNISGSGALVKGGVGTLSLTGDNTYTGGTRVDAGTLQGPAPSIRGNVLLAAPSARVTFEQTANGSYGGIVSGSGGLTKTGDKSLGLHGNNTYTGTTTISEGTLKIGYNPAGAVLWLDAANPGSLAFSADGKVNRWTSLVGSTYAGIASGGPTYQPNVQAGQPVLRFSGTNPLTFDAPLTANGTTMFIMFRTDSTGYTQPVDSSGTSLHQTHAAPYAGNRCAVTTGGDMRIEGSFPAAGQWHVQEVQVKGGDWKLWIDNNLLGTSANGTAIGPFINVGGNMPGDIGEVLTYSGVLSDVARTETYNYLAAKWMRTGFNSIPDASPVAIAAGATLDLAGYHETVGPLSGSGQVLLGSGKLTVNSVSDSELSGAISGAGGLTKTGDGELTLSGTNVYTGGTVVSEGTLAIAAPDALPAGGGLTIDAGGTVVLSSGLSASASGANGASPSGTAVPEPAAVSLLAVGVLAALATWLRHRRRSAG